MNFVKKINFILLQNSKKKLFFLFVFSIFISFVELAGISLIIPFVAVINNHNYVFENKYMNFVYEILNMQSAFDFACLIGVFLVFYYLFRAVALIAHTYAVSKFSKLKYIQISQTLFFKILHLDYVAFTNTKESDLTKSITSDAFNVSSSLMHVLSIITEFFILIFLYALMLYADFKLTLFISLVLLLSIVIVLKLISPKIKKCSTEKEKNQRSFFAILSQVIGNYKIFKMSAKKQQIVQDMFHDASAKFSASITVYDVASQFPRLFLETIMFLMLVSVAFFILFDFENTMSDKIHILSFIMLAVYRMLPCINRILNAYNQILFRHKSIDIVYDIYKIKQENFKDNEIKFDNDIRLKNLEFSYEKNTKILSDINLNIKKGSKIAIIGSSGSGKSTMIDIIMGLIVPSKNALFVDDACVNENNLISWRNKIAYVPQGIYLFDTSIAENIYFGNTRDDNKIIDVLKKVCMYDFVMSLKDGIETNVGSNGVKLSGGQRQRIAIARTLYSDYDVLILDEATSALDEKTEKAIMHEILSSNIDQTIIIVTHRLSSIKDCDYIYEVKNGALIQKNNTQN